MNDHPKDLGRPCGHTPPDFEDRPAVAVVRALLVLGFIGSLLFYLH